MSAAGRSIVVSNRLPLTIVPFADGFRVQRSGGGLVSALNPVLSERGGCWAGWTGTDHDERIADLLREPRGSENYALAPVFLTEEESVCYYQGFSNEIIWPLFHGLPSRCHFGSAYWNAYRRANGKFADTVCAAAQDGDFIWVHDYHLMILGDALRSRGLRQSFGYFHHIPFPAPDVFETLPWRVQVLQALMRFDSIGFQTPRDCRNFIACLRRFLPAVDVARNGDGLIVHAGRESARIGAYPISIDYEGFVADASEPDVEVAAAGIAHGFSGAQIIIGVDRLDYTKGIPERLGAFEALLERKPELRGRVAMVQIVVPSRENIAEYRHLQSRIETLVSKINGEYSSPGWVPIHYLYRSVSRSELIAFYRAADVAMVTPLRDGMNLVAKEFCASRVDNRGVLVLSEFAGAAEELGRNALTVNPYDTENVSVVLEMALEMDEAEQGARMKRMRSYIRTHDVFRWARSFTEAEASFVAWGRQGQAGNMGTGPDVPEGLARVSRR